MKVGRVIGVLKYNSVFLENSEDQELVETNGYGAKLFSDISLYRLNESQDKIENGVEQEREELLMLFDEEAFYLFKHDHIDVKHHIDDPECVSHAFLWSKFVEKNANFPLKYVVYAHFRDKGFVVKTGIHFGIDYTVYRTVPMLCHSEICATVVDATQSRTLKSIEEGHVVGTGQIGWRHLATLTRVMPDVMKMLTLCYVQPKRSASGDRVDDLFGVGADSACLDFTSPGFIDAVEVKSMTCLVRRQLVNSETYKSAAQIQSKYRAGSLLKHARQKQVSKKKRKKRRDHTEVREKHKSSQTLSTVQEEDVETEYEGMGLLVSHLEMRPTMWR